MKFVGGKVQSATFSGEDTISLKNYDEVLVLIITTISSGTDTGAVTLKQASDVAGTGEKALSFTRYFANASFGSGDTLTEAAATSNTFNAGGAAASQMYLIPVKAEMLDVTNGFDCLRADVADITNGTYTVLLIGTNARHGGAQSVLPTMITD
jgi:hypothetical protein